jgi:hypothetical protein
LINGLENRLGAGSVPGLSVSSFKDDNKEENREMKRIKFPTDHAAPRIATAPSGRSAEKRRSRDRNHR